MRKRFNFISVIVLFITASLFIFSCDNSLIVDVDPEITVETDSMSTAEVDPDTTATAENEYIKSKLLKYTLLSEYKRLDTDEITEVRVFISSFNRDSSDHIFTVEKNDESINVLPEYDIKIDIFDITDNTNGKKCYVLMPNDVRLGSVFFVSDSGHWNDYNNEDDSDLNFNSREYFCEAIIEPFIEQAKKILDVWKDITEDEIETQRKKYLGTTRDYSVDSLKMVYGKEEQMGKDVALITNNWGQGSYFNDAIEKVYKANYVAGCGPVALAIVASYLRWPESFVEYTDNDRIATLSVLKNAWPKHDDWDGKYDWDAIYKGNSKGQFQTAALLFNVAETMLANYGTGGTSVYAIDIGKSLDRLGFNYELYYGDSLGQDKVLNLVSSIEEKCVPAIAAGAGHAFVVDGAKVTKKAVTFKRYTIGETVKITDILTYEIENPSYHCNLGWDGYRNGWYLPDHVAGKYNTSFLYYDIAIADTDKVEE